MVGIDPGTSRLKGKRAYHWATAAQIIVLTTPFQKSQVIFSNAVKNLNMGTNSNPLNAVAQWLRASNILNRQYLSGAGSSPDGSVGRELYLQKLHYQYLTTSVAVVLVVRWYING